MVAFPELGFYTLAGAPETPRALIAEVREAEELGLGACFISERYNIKEAATGFSGALDGKATTQDLEHVATLIPDEWLASAATGTADQCAAAVRGQFDLGANGVIMHGATPAELAPIVAAYAAVRPVPSQPAGEGND